MKKRSNGEGSIYRRADGRWCGSYFDKKYKRHYIYGKTMKEAKEKLNAAIAKLDEEEVSGSEMLLQEWVLQYFEVYKKNTLKETTYSSYMITYRTHILDSPVGKLRLKDVSLEDLQRYYNSKISEGYNSKTVRHINLHISGALDMAVRLHYVKENVAKYVILPQKKKYETAALDIKSIETLVSEAKEEIIYPMVLLGLLCGMRKGEVMGLLWENVDFEKRTIKVQYSLCKIIDTAPNEEGHYLSQLKLLEPKNRSSIREIPMTNDVYNALIKQKERQDIEKEQYKEIYVDQGLVFADSMGNFVKPRQFNDQFHRLLEKYCIPQVRFHDLRHSFASALLHEGVSIRTIQDLLGHASITTSMDIYAHVTEDLKEEAVEKIDFTKRQTDKN